VDADGLNNLSDLGDLSLLRGRKGVTVLTPHVGEFSRLTGHSPEDVVSNQLDLAAEFAVTFGCYVVLKSARTVIATPEGRTFVSLRGTPAMAKAGTGDVLAGILVSLLGRGMEAEEALKLGVYLHGLAGEIAEGKKHRESLRARDLTEAIPQAYRCIEKQPLEKYPEGSDTIYCDDRQG